MGQRSNVEEIYMREIYKTLIRKHRNKSWPWIWQWILRYDTKSTSNNKNIN